MTAPSSGLVRDLVWLQLAVVALPGCGGGEELGRAGDSVPRPPSEGEWRSIGWERLRVVGERVTVRYEGGGCVVGEAGDVPVRPVVAETGTGVTIAVFVASGNPCAGVGVFGEATVRLDEPLGDRRLVHAAVDR